MESIRNKFEKVQKMSCIIQIQTAGMGYLSLAPSAYVHACMVEIIIFSIICTLFMQNEVIYNPQQLQLNIRNNKNTYEHFHPNKPST